MAVGGVPCLGLAPDAEPRPPRFGAVCPQDGKRAALVLPVCNTAAMNLHLAEIGEMVSPGRHAVLLLDQAG
jgi:hypothetical protein